MHTTTSSTPTPCSELVQVEVDLNLEPLVPAPAHGNVVVTKSRPLQGGGGGTKYYADFGVFYRVPTHPKGPGDIFYQFLRILYQGFQGPQGGSLGFRWTFLFSQWAFLYMGGFRWVFFLDSIPSDFFSFASFAWYHRLVA